MASKYTRDSNGTDIAADLSTQIRGKTVLVTGVSPNGLGAFFCETIAKHSPATLIIAGRNPTKTQQTADAIAKASPTLNIKSLELDLASLRSARKAAEEVNSWTEIESIDVLVNNAGIMAVDYGVTEDGFERQFGTNHLGPFLFTNLIIGKVMKAPEPRVVMVSSDGHRLSPIRFTDYGFNNGEHYNKWASYGQSKTANLLMALSLAEKLGPKGLQAFSIHPGQILTGLGDHVSWDTEYESLRQHEIIMGNKEMWYKSFNFKTHDQGIATHVYVSFSPDLKEHNGAYFQDSRLADPYKEEVHCWGTDRIEADKLWKLSEKLVGQEFTY